MLETDIFDKLPLINRLIPVPWTRIILSGSLSILTKKISTIIEILIGNSLPDSFPIDLTDNNIKVYT